MCMAMVSRVAKSRGWQQQTKCRHRRRLLSSITHDCGFFFCVDCWIVDRNHRKTRHYIRWCSDGSDQGVPCDPVWSMNLHQSMKVSVNRKMHCIQTHSPNAQKRFLFCFFIKFAIDDKWICRSIRESIFMFNLHMFIYAICIIRRFCVHCRAADRSKLAVRCM